MSWIRDVRDELHRLKRTPRELRKFGYLVGSVFLLISLAGVFKHWSLVILVILGIAGVYLLAAGLLFPVSLRRVYGIWMGFAFALGWIVSRIILILLFYLILTPIGIAARLSGKKFIDTSYPDSKSSFWIAKGESAKINYDKMV